MLFALWYHTVVDVWFNRVCWGFLFHLELNCCLKSGPEHGCQIDGYHRRCRYCRWCEKKLLPLLLHREKEKEKSKSYSNAMGTKSICFNVNWNYRWKMVNSFRFFLLIENKHQESNGQCAKIHRTRTQKIARCNINHDDKWSYKFETHNKICVSLLSSFIHFGCFSSWIQSPKRFHMVNCGYCVSGCLNVSLGWFYRCNILIQTLREQEKHQQVTQNTKKNDRDGKRQPQR